MASEPRCSKPGCGALKIVGKPCTDADCPQQWVHHTDTRPAPAATDTGLVTVLERPYLGSLVARSQAEELLAAKEAEIAALKKINAMIMGDDENAPRYTTKRLKQEVERVTQVMRGEASDREAYVKTLEADNAAQAARIKELEQINASLMGDDEDKPRYMTKRLKQEIARATEALETKLAAAENGVRYALANLRMNKSDEAFLASVLGRKPS